MLYSKYKPLIELLAKQYPKSVVNSFCSSVVGKNGQPKTMVTTMTTTTTTKYRSATVTFTYSVNVTRPLLPPRRVHVLILFLPGVVRTSLHFLPTSCTETRLQNLRYTEIEESRTKGNVDAHSSPRTWLQRRRIGLRRRNRHQSIPMRAAYEDGGCR